MDAAQRPAQSEHILVCLSSAPSNENIIRTAAHMAQAFGGSLTALYVQPADASRLSAENQRRLQEHIRLAQKLGADIATVNGQDIPYQIAEFARLSHVTRVVIGHSSTSRRGFGKKSLTERLIDLAPYLDIHIIPDMTGKNRSHRPPLPTGRLWPALWQWLLSLILLAAATAVGTLFARLRFTEANIVTVYLLGVLLTALFTRSYLCSGLVSLASVLLFNFFFTEPRLSFRAYESGYPFTFAIMLAASLITGTLANRLAEHARSSAEAAARTQVLFETNQLLQKTDDEAEILRITAVQVLKLVDRELVLYPEADGNLGQEVSYQPESFVPDPAAEPFDRSIALWVLQNKKRAGAFTGAHSGAKSQYLAIRSNGAAYGVIGIRMTDKPPAPFENSVLLSILGEGALAMESCRNAREKEQAALLAKHEQLRANLLRAISHDLRTPLTSISGNAENLLANDAFLDSSDRKAVLTDIHNDSIWLIQLVENLLSITRIGEGRTDLTLTTQLVEEVVTESLRHIRSGGGHNIRTHITDELLLAKMDARLISQVIINLVDNAIKYTPVGSTITVSACRAEEMAAITVADDGPGVPDHSKQRVFDMFYTGDNQVADCHRSLGLGLSLCRSIVGAHGGEITLTDNVPHGAVFTFTIPASEVTLNE